MIKKTIMLLALLLISQVGYAAIVPTHISTDTVDFNSTLANVVTFNSATRHIWLWNEDKDDDCYVDFICTSTEGVKGWQTNGTVKLMKVPAYGSDITPNTIELDLSIVNMGFISDSGAGKITYRVTGDMPL